MLDDRRKVAPVVDRRLSVVRRQKLSEKLIMGVRGPFRPSQIFFLVGLGSSKPPFSDSFSE
jgi:hypothetical protein